MYEKDLEDIDYTIGDRYNPWRYRSDFLLLNRCLIVRYIPTKQRGTGHTQELDLIFEKEI